MDAVFPNGWVHYLAGGLVIGAGVALLFLATGLIGGVSTFFTAVWSYVSRQPYFQQTRFVATRDWRVVYAIGLVAGALVWLVASGAAPFVTHVTWWQLALGGFIAGFGARLSSGCTSGHGICGLASLQLPSLLAVLIFLATAIVTAHAVRAFGGA
ncbi:MAG TPA: YeeE/YedE thiosulfate transporter family protein [Casimicrobiaceae bacterium]|nr:YeeE/YedE thiosulfate transporter family protein [Casimicrobiaceae bacterium]